jgi:hypothetical protein
MEARSSPNSLCPAPSSSPSYGRADACNPLVNLSRETFGAPVGTLAALVWEEFPLGKRLVTLAELADYLDVTPGELWELFEDEDDGGLPAIRIGDEWYVPLDDFPDWLLRFADKRKN